MALLLPDPCDPLCPESFKTEARQTLLSMQTRPSSWTKEIETDQGLQAAMLRFIANFSNWDMADNQTYLNVGRTLVMSANGRNLPMVVDPFAGGGSIPMEALRVGCEAFASDLNPVSCLILKVMLDDIPRHGFELAQSLRLEGKLIKKQAEQDLAELYPLDADGATPIAYLWARTVRCESPDCGSEIPLMRSFWLCKKSSRKQALRFRIEDHKHAPARIKFQIFNPNSDDEVPRGTVARAKATCLCCGSILPPERVRAQLSSVRGGADVLFDRSGRRIGGAIMTAVVTLRKEETGRHYRLPTSKDYAAVRKAQEHEAEALREWVRGGKNGLCPIPDEPTPVGGGSGASRAFSVQRYGMFQWGDLFTARQKVALMKLSHLISERTASSKRKLSSPLAAVLSRCADHWSSGAMWIQDLEAVAHTFGRQALPIVWDFVEACGFRSKGGANWEGQVDWVARVIDRSCDSRVADWQLADATNHPLPDESADVWFTDPPYYDAVPYADLSDFFLVWLKRALPNDPILRDPFDPLNPLSPKTSEVVQDETRLAHGQRKDRSWFEERMSQAFGEGRRILKDDGIGSVVFAHKTTEGWEALLSGMIRGGWTITGSWPIATERSARLRARDSAALATSIHLVGRPRSENAPVGDWADVLRDLPVRVASWMNRLQSEGIRGADLVFACVGPALEIYSRYKAVETAEGNLVSLPDYLEKVWEVVGRAALQQVLGSEEEQAQVGIAGALEEDARLTSLFLWTLQSTEVAEQDSKIEQNEEETVAKIAAKGFSLPFDVVRRFAQPMGIDLATWTDRIIAQEKGRIRLLPVQERAAALFGSNESNYVSSWVESERKELRQMTLFPELLNMPKSEEQTFARKKLSEEATKSQNCPTTTLDRLHTGMLLQANGYANELRSLISAEQDRGWDFMRLANALSALYPNGSLEKRLLDAMLLVAQR